MSFFIAGAVVAIIIFALVVGFPVFNRLRRPGLGGAPGAAPARAAAAEIIGARLTSTFGATKVRQMTASWWVETTTSKLLVSVSSEHTAQIEASAVPRVHYDQQAVAPQGPGLESVEVLSDQLTAAVRGATSEDLARNVELAIATLRDLLPQVTQSASPSGEPSHGAG